MNDTKKRNEIRIVNPPSILFSKISKDASKNKRSVAKQAEYIIEKWYEQGQVILKK